MNHDHAERAGGAMLAARQHITTGGFAAGARVSVEPAMAHGMGATEGRWRPRAAGGDGVPAQFVVRLRVSDMLERARRWVERPGTKLERYLNESLAEYLSERDRNGALVTNHGERMAEFRAAFGNALKASDPLVLLDRSLYSRVHLSLGEPKVAMVVEPLPFDESHPARKLARDLLLGSQKVDETEVDRKFGSGNAGSVSIISYLDYPAHPVVYSSLMAPIAATWQKAGVDGGEKFWHWSRSRPLAEAVPLPSGVRQAMVRGWFTAKVLGLVDCADPQKAYRIALAKGGVAAFPYPLLGRKIGRLDSTSALPAVLESFGVALAQYSSTGDKSLLAPYRRLVELGLSDVHTFALDYDHLSAELEEFVVTGEVKGAIGPAVVAGSTREERTAALCEVLEQSAKGYREIAASEVSRDTFFDLPRVTEIATEAARSLDLILEAARRDRATPGIPL